MTLTYQRGHTNPSQFLFTGCAALSLLQETLLVPLPLLPTSSSLWTKAPPSSPPTPSHDSHQVHVRYEVSQHSSGDPKGPNPISLPPENPQVEILAHLSPALLPDAPAAQLVLPVVLRVTGRRQDGPVGHGQEDLDEH